MSDVILSIAIFHSLCALALILGSALSALRRRPPRGTSWSVPPRTAAPVPVETLLTPAQVQAVAA